MSKKRGTFDEAIVAIQKECDAVAWAAREGYKQYLSELRASISVLRACGRAMIREDPIEYFPETVGRTHVLARAILHARKTRERRSK